MPEQDPIEQRIAGIEAALDRCGKTYGKAWTYRRFYDEIPWLIAQLREARGQVATLQEKRELLESVVSMEIAALRKAEQEREAWRQTHKELLSRAADMLRERDEARRDAVRLRTALEEIQCLWDDPTIEPCECARCKPLAIDAAMSAHKAEPDVLE